MTKNPVGRPRKEGQFVNCYIKKEIAEALNKFCNNTGLPKTAAVEHAIALYLANYEKTKQI